jgi:Ca-activated chloride channel family protein
MDLYRTEEDVMKNMMNVRCTLSRDMLLVTGAEQVVYALVDIRAQSENVFGTLPGNIALVLDRSGSMDGDKMNNVKEAVGYILDHLGDQDLISVIIFDDQFEAVVPSQRAQNRDEIKSRIAKIEARGGTQISDALTAALGEVRKGYAKNRVNRILLLTDGQTWDDEDACLKRADEAGSEGIAVTTAGIGEEWNEKLLLQIAERSRGNSHWIQNPIAILDAFRQEVDGIQSVAATSLRVTARMSPGVVPVRAYATIPMISDMTARAVSGSNVQADLGTLDSRRGQAFLIEARVPARTEGPFHMGEVEISYETPSQGSRRRSARADLHVTFTADTSAAAKVNARVMNLVEKVSAFKLQTRALTEAAAGDIVAATRKFEAAATMLLKLGEDDLAKAVDREIASLKTSGMLTAAGTKRLEYGTRKLTQVLPRATK